MGSGSFLGVFALRLRGRFVPVPSVAGRSMEVLAVGESLAFCNVAEVDDAYSLWEVDVRGTSDKQRARRQPDMDAQAELTVAGRAALSRRRVSVSRSHARRVLLRTTTNHGEPAQTRQD